MLATTMMFVGCGNSNQQTQTESSEEIQLVTETDSLSSDLSAASDSVEQKVNELQLTLDSLNN
ncbi:hypothetical protein ACKGJO_08930 [Gracilimonas sp. Q87]|uniref:hypothetical protein n=1 Tax=Gracilimonas sp. Q87 TaxID=3384766 RepID=UPI003983ED69